MLEPFFSPIGVEAGCDEAGRGCLAGPVFAAAVVLPRDFSHPLLNDSKQLTERQRETLRPVIEAEAIGWQVAAVEAAEIDRINILNASFLAMTRAVEGLKSAPDLLLIDGNRFRSALEIPYRCIVRGDGIYASIAAASVLAKTYRDDYMRAIDREFPVYGWRQNKGYPTLAHRRAIVEHGLSPHHRLTFNSGGDQLTLF
jgi:ribonuclease HII